VDLFPQKKVPASVQKLGHSVGPPQKLNGCLSKPVHVNKLHLLESGGTEESLVASSCSSASSEMRRKERRSQCASSKPTGDY
jgi:hypothetical protein